jgi:hypothetical protein
MEKQINEENVIQFAPCEQNACCNSTQGLGDVVGETSQPVVQLLDTRFAPLTLGRHKGLLQIWAAAGAGCRRHSSLILLIRQVLHRHWSRLSWHIPVGEPFQLFVVHGIQVRQLGKPARWAFAGENTQPFVSALGILADPCSWATPGLLPA